MNAMIDCIKFLVSPHISEKGTLAAEKSGQIIFKVLPDATKPEIKGGS